MYVYMYVCMSACPYPCGWADFTGECSGGNDLHEVLTNLKLLHIQNGHCKTSSITGYT